ncbi:alkaline phosphatase family protein [Anaerolineae bacterium CFX7]|nr:alkaline phosphatase family protein [Anaerolineae bacterium CFX7]
MKKIISALCVGALLLLGRSVAQAQTPQGLDKIKHVVILYLENRTTDNLYSLMQGVNGVNGPDGHIIQVDKNDQPYETLPPVLISLEYAGMGRPIDELPGLPDPRFPKDLPNQPFLIDQYVPNNQLLGTPVHRYYEHILQMNLQPVTPGATCALGTPGCVGKMNKYVAWTDVGGQVMGYYDTTKLPLFPYAQHYAFADHFFTAAFGGSWLNHMWLVCACTPPWPNAPAEFISKPVFDANGKLIGVDDSEFQLVSPDGYGINTGIESFYPPHSLKTPADHLMPPVELPTLGDRLSEKNISWNEYNGGWQDALDHAPEQPIPLVPMPPLSSHVYFKPYGPDMPGRAHLRDSADFIGDVVNNKLAAVSIVKPAPPFDEHAGYSIIETAEQHAVLMIQALMLSSYWNDTAIFITYDDFGGWYDHVPPPTIDRWGPGGRVPLIVISPYAKHGFIDRNFYDTTALLKFIETRWQLAPLSARDAGAQDLTNLFDFTQPPSPPFAPDTALGQDFSPPAAPSSAAAAEPSVTLTLTQLALAALLGLGAVGLVVLLLRRRAQKRAS